MVTKYFSDLDWALFIRGGSIIPLLQHEGCLALLQCKNNSISLEVYPDELGNAEGELYLDDGETF